MFFIREYAGDRSIPVEHCEGMAAPHLPKILAEMTFEVSDSYLDHGRMIVTSGHAYKAWRCPRRVIVMS